MTPEDEVTRPPWLSDELFPFPSRWFTTPDGHRMHYVDEGSGPVIVFLHGNPSWSFEFRHLIGELRRDFRCIAIDHVGFGLSSRSLRKQDHTPQAHAGRFSALINHLDVKDATFYMSDWGGPVGLHFACQQPERVTGVAIANTWCWPVGSDMHFVFFSSFMRSPLGQFLIKRRNFFVNGVMPRAVGVKSALTAEVMDHYRNAQPPGGRHASAALPGHIVGAGSWLRSIWDARAAFRDKPALILWGLKDIAFRRKELERWRAELSNPETHTFDDVGHFVAEEAPERVAPLLREFVGRIGN